MKAPGCCTICDREVFEVMSRYPDDDPQLAGRPRTVGRPLADAIRATIQLSDGSLLDQTVCPACSPPLPSRLLSQAVRAFRDYAERDPVRREALLEQGERLQRLSAGALIALRPWSEILTPGVVYGVLA